MNKEFLENILNDLEEEFEYYEKINELNEEYDKPYINPPEGLYIAIDSIAQDNEKVKYVLEWWINIANFGKNKDSRIVTDKKENKDIELKNNQDFVKFLIDKVLKEKDD